MTRLDVERIELREFTAGVQADTARRLELLRAIESTLAWLQRLTGQLRTDAAFAEKVTNGLEKISGVIDPDESIQNSLENAQIHIDELHKLLIEKRQHGRNDRQLTEEDGIEAGYNEAIDAAADLNNIINTLRWNIGEHDIEAAPKVLNKTYEAKDVDKMFDDLLAP